MTLHSITKVSNRDKHYEIVEADARADDMPMDCNRNTVDDKSSLDRDRRVSIEPVCSRLDAIFKSEGLQQADRERSLKHSIET